MTDFSKMFTYSCSETAERAYLTKMFTYHCTNDGRPSFMEFYEDGAYLNCCKTISYWRLKGNELFFTHEISDKWYRWDNDIDEDGPTEKLIIDGITNYFLHKAFF